MLTYKKNESNKHFTFAILVHPKKAGLDHCSAVHFIIHWLRQRNIET